MKPTGGQPEREEQTINTQRRKHTDGVDAGYGMVLAAVMQMWLIM